MSAVALIGCLALAAAPAHWSGRFRSAGNLSSPRTGHTATLLKDGRVLVVGGRGVEALVELASCEMYEPSRNAWKPVAPLAHGRSGHTATLLDDGRVLVTGGVAHNGDSFVAAATAELYDPATHRWSAAAPMAEARNVHSAVRLSDGRVLVAGGVREQKGPLNSVEVFDPKKNTWQTLAPLSSARSGHRAVLLPEGDVLLVGGRGAKVLSSTERWSATKGEWTAGPELREARQQHGVLALADGRVMVVGGLSSGGLSNLVELWDSRSNLGWQLAEHSLSTAHSAFGAVMLKGGDVLLTGGEAYSTVDTGLAQRFVLSEQKWCTAGQMSTPRKHHTATSLPDGRVLVTGGVSSGINEASAELWEPAPGPCHEPPGLSLEP